MSRRLTQLVTADDDERACESFEHLATLLERRFSLDAVQFTDARRIEHLPGDGMGWMCTIAFTLKTAGPAVLQVRDALNAIQVRISPYLRVDSTDGHRRWRAPCVLRAVDFPSMWIMERIRRS